MADDRKRPAAQEQPIDPVAGVALRMLALYARARGIDLSVLFKLPIRDELRELAREVYQDGQRALLSRLAPELGLGDEAHEREVLAAIRALRYRPSSPAGTWDDSTPVVDRTTPDVGTRASRLPTLPPPKPDRRRP